MIRARRRGVVVNPETFEPELQVIINLPIEAMQDNQATGADETALWNEVIAAVKAAINGTS